MTHREVQSDHATVAAYAARARAMATAPRYEVPGKPAATSQWDLTHYWHDTCPRWAKRETQPCQP